MVKAQNTRVKKVAQSTKISKKRGRKPKSLTHVESQTSTRVPHNHEPFLSSLFKKVTSYFTAQTSSDKSTYISNHSGTQIVVVYEVSENQHEIIVLPSVESSIILKGSHVKVVAILHKKDSKVYDISLDANHSWHFHASFEIGKEEVEQSKIHIPHSSTSAEDLIIAYFK